MKKVVFIALCALLAGCVSDKLSLNEVKDLTYSTVLRNNENEDLIPFRLYAPEYKPGEKYPLIVYLHDDHQRGTNNVDQLEGAVGRIIKFSRDHNYPAFVAAPQCPQGLEWKDDICIESINGLIRAMSSRPEIDTSAIYLTGVGMGGEGAWYYAFDYPESISTIVPVCGGQLAIKRSQNPQVPVELSEVNVWVINYLDDGIRSPDFDRKVLSHIWTQYTAMARYTDFMTGGHTSEIYSDINFMGWLMATKRPTRNTSEKE